MNEEKKEMEYVKSGVVDENNNVVSDGGSKLITALKIAGGIAAVAGGIFGCIRYYKKFKEDSESDSNDVDEIIDETEDDELETNIEETEE